jgi:hypothetical protein
MCVIHFSVVERNVSWQSNYKIGAREKAERAAGGVAQPLSQRAEEANLFRCYYYEIVHRQR